MSNIYQSLSEVMKRISAISKDQKNTLQNYKFRGIDDVYNELHKHFADCGIFNLPRVTNRIEERYKSKQGADMIRVVLYVEYDLIALDGSKITIGPVIGEGNDSSDKASNKALSAAHKYALLQAFLIPTEDMAEADKDHNEIKFQPKPEAKEIPKEIEKIVKDSLVTMEKIGGVSKAIVNHAPKANEPITYKNFKFSQPKEFKGKRFDEIEWAVLDDYMNAIAWKYTNKDIPDIVKDSLVTMEKIGGVSKAIVNHAPKANEPITYKNFKFSQPKEFKGKRFDEIEWAVLDDYMNAIAWKYTNKDIPEKVQWFFDLFTDIENRKDYKMKIELAKWELGVLLENKKHLALVRNDLSYDDIKRIEKLQKFLDAQIDNLQIEPTSLDKAEF